MRKRKFLVGLFLSIFILSACSPLETTQAPGFIYTVVAGTQTAAAWQTQAAEAHFTKTPTQATLRPTFTAYPTSTSFLFLVTPSSTPTLTPSATRTPSKLTEWPDWKTGSVVTMPKGSGENIGTNKFFRVLKGVQVIVVRGNGVALRPIPNKAIDGPMEEKGSAFTLTGIMNKNSDFGWLFVQVIAANGKTYWVGGSAGDGNIDPTVALEFYYPPQLTETPTPSPSPTLTPPPVFFPSITPSPVNTP
ncbi:MAG: hypothetical protein HN855_09900 [Anaerolineae bacterium]|jgi:hypothetical protein|nr:hypothetical protein [Anaerolineae bacterium]MBT7325462.1 hypothetical protein [Anaerolineae bacterium]